MALKLGMFLTPATLPARATSEIIDWNLDVIRKAEEVGYAEVWVGSHITSRWSPIAVPQHVIARALGSDYSDPWAREGWFRSMELLATEVMPRLGDLVVPEGEAL